MPSQIDITQPPEGQATTAAVRQNFAFAKEEIEALQTRVAEDEIYINNNTEAIADTINRLNDFIAQQAATDQIQDSWITILKDDVEALKGQVNDLSIRVSNLEAIPP